RRRAFAASGLSAFPRVGALLLGARRPVATLVGDVFAVVLPVLPRVLAVVVKVFARVFTVVVEVVPGVVVHVAAAMPPVRAVVVVVVHGRANRDAGRKPYQRADHGRFSAVVLLLDDDGLCRRRRCGVDDLRFVLRHVDNLRVGGLDDDRLLPRRGRLRRDGLLRCALQRA